MRKLEPESVSAVVTDPPYGLKFMGKEWDDAGQGAQQREWHRRWLEQAYRVLVPGGLLAAFAGSRTYHHLACAAEDVGFVIVDELMWLYGSGFPKSLDVSKAIDKQRDDREQAVVVTKWITSFKPDSWSITKWRAHLNEHVIGADNCSGSAQSWTTTSKIGSHKPRVPTLDQIPLLLEVLGVKPADVPEDIARLIYELNGRKGQPGENWFKREVIGKRVTGAAMSGMASGEELGTGGTAFGSGQNIIDLTAPATDQAAQWEGWGTALKPAHEPILLAAKPGNRADNTQGREA